MMRWATQCIVGCLFLTAITGCSSATQEKNLSGTTLREELELLSESKVLLGHQSVGRDVLNGLRMLSKEAGVPLRIEEVGAASVPNDVGIYHSHIGKNGDPAGKCEAFAALLSRAGVHYDVGMMKFCYVDLDESSTLNVEQLLDQYDSLVQQVKKLQPEMTLIHVTIPLRSDPPGWKTYVKRVLGRATWEDEANELRNAFNEALRQRYAGEPIFDLAQAESTLPDGSRSYFKKNDRIVYTLATDYTHDGGHLNERGQRHVAASLIRTLAGVLRNRSAAETA